MSCFYNTKDYHLYINILRESIALRVFSIRKYLIKLSIKELTSSYRLKSNMISNIENNHLSLLSKKNLEDLFECFYCELSKINLTENFTKNFLFHGKGEVPHFYFDIIYNYYIECNDIDEGLIKDVELIQSRYKNSLILMVQDESNAPFLSFGDFVIYAWREAKSIESLKKVLCVVEI